MERSQTYYQQQMNCSETTPAMLVFTIYDCDAGCTRRPLCNANDLMHCWSAKLIELLLLPLLVEQQGFIQFLSSRALEPPRIVRLGVTLAQEVPSRVRIEEDAHRVSPFPGPEEVGQLREQLGECGERGRVRFCPVRPAGVCE